MSNISGVSSSGNNILIDGNQVTEVTSKSSPIEIKNGSTLTGKVLTVSDENGEKIANIDIGNATISARLSEGMGLREGQVLSFAVRGSGSNGISITPLLENTSIMQSTQAALRAAGLDLSSANLQMVKEMMEAGLPVDKSSLLEMSKNLNTYQNASVSTLVEMESLNIPINENNIEQFTNYKNYEHQVTMEMTAIIDELPQALDGLMNSGNTSAAVNLYGNILKIFGGEIGAETAQNIEGTVEGASENAGNAASTGVVEGKEGTIASEGATAEVIAKTAEEASESGALSSAAQRALALLSQDKDGSLVASTGKDITPQGKLSNEFLDNLQNLNVSDKTIQNLSKETINGSTETTKLLFKELAGAFENADLSNPVEMASWKKLFSSNEFKSLLKDNITDQWLLKPLDVEKKENIDNLYQRLGTQAKALAETISNTLGAESKLAQAANNLSNNLDFMNQLNQMFQYIQLPLQMAGQNANGDLYVYRNKNKRMSEDGSVSAILHLDMENLGPVDVYVKLLDTKVTTNFYVADDEVIELINDNIHILNERLEKRGYSMQANIMLHDAENGENDAVDELLSVARTPLLSTTSFDARA